MGVVISTRNDSRQPEIFPVEIPRQINGFLKCGMGKTKPAEPPEIYLGQWLKYFDIGPSVAAEVAGCTQGYISNIKAGRRENINYLYLWRIADHYGVTIDDFFRKPPLVLDAELSPKAKATIRARHRRMA